MEGREIRGEIKARKETRKEGRRGSEGRREGTAAAARRVYTHRCVVDRVFLLMSLAEAAELAHEDTRERTVGEGAQARTHAYMHVCKNTHRRE